MSDSAKSASYFDYPIGGEPNSATAYRVANYWHTKNGQFYNGDPYVYHCLGVASYFAENTNEHMLALVHDVIEDTDAEIADIRHAIPEVCIEALEAITRKRGEPYEEYLERCGQNKIALRVKMADASYNLAHCFSPAGLCVNRSLAERYSTALSHLFEIANGKDE